MATDFDADAFDGVMARLDAGVIVVTVADGDERAGCLVGFHCQCSIEPRRYAVWLSKANHTYRVALRADALAVHLLSEDGFDLAERFGSETGDDTDKFRGLAVTTGPHGVPLLDRCPDRLLLRRITLLDDGGDHVCLVGEPEQAWCPEHDGGVLRVSAVTQLTPGHEADERPHPE